MHFTLSKEQFEMVMKMVKGSPLYSEGDKEVVLKELRKAEECGMSHK